MTTTTTNALSQITTTERKLTGAVDQAAERLDAVAGESLESALHRLALAAEGARQRLADATFKLASIVSDLLSDMAGLGDEITEQLAEDNEERRREEEIRQEALRIYQNGRQAREAQQEPAALALPDATGEEEPLAVQVAANGPAPRGWEEIEAGMEEEAPAPRHQQEEEEQQQQEEDYTTGRVAEICGVSGAAVARWFDAGKLRGYRDSQKRRRIPRASLEAFMADNGIVPGLTDDADAPDGDGRKEVPMG
jgi:excisionase family DNA binding protein